MFNSWVGNCFNLSNNNLWSKNTCQRSVVRPHQSHTTQPGLRWSPCHRPDPVPVVPSSLLSSRDRHRMKRPSLYGTALCSTQQKTYRTICINMLYLQSVHSLSKPQVILLCSATIPHGSCCKMVRSVDNNMLISNTPAYFPQIVNTQIKLFVYTHSLILHYSTVYTHGLMLHYSTVYIYSRLSLTQFKYI